MENIRFTGSYRGDGFNLWNCQICHKQRASLTVQELYVATKQIEAKLYVIGIMPNEIRFEVVTLGGKSRNGYAAVQFQIRVGPELDEDLKSVGMNIIENDYIK